MARAHGAYYVEQLPNYCYQSGEPLGIRFGEGATTLGLVAEVDDDAFIAVVAVVGRALEARARCGASTIVGRGPTKYAPLVSAIKLRVRLWVGRHRVRLVVTAVLIGVASGLVMGIAAGARRTASAPDRYTRSAGGDPDLLITQLSGRPLNDLVAQLPGVTSAQALVFVPSFLVSPLDGSLLLEPNSFAGHDDTVGERVVVGRFSDPARPNEFTVNRPLASFLAERFGTRVGDDFQVASYDQSQVAANFTTVDKPAVARFTATLVGVTESPTEFDDPSQQVVFPGSFLAAHPDVGVVQTRIAVHVAAGVDPHDVMNAVHQLPNGADAYAMPSRVVSDSARRAVRFQVTALWLVCALSAIAAAVVIVQLVSRTVRVSGDERQALLALGWRRSDLAVERSIEGGIAAALAAPTATIVAYLLTKLFPLGVLRSFEPDRGARIDWLVTALGVVGGAAVVMTTAAIVGNHHTRRATARGIVAGFADTAATRGARMPLSVGARFASTDAGGRRSWFSLLAGVVGVAGLVGATLVGLSVTRIVERPDRWGVNYDALFGNPFVDTAADIVTPILDNPDVLAVTGANIGSVTINGSDTATIGFDSAKGHLLPTVLNGRDPRTVGEIGLGAEVARRLHVNVDDAVQVAGDSGEPRKLTVVGIVVTPGSAGNGAAMTFDAYHELNSRATQNLALVDFRPGSPADVADAVAAANFTPPGALITPTSVRALERVTAAPFLLAAVLTLLLVVACAYLLTTSVRARQRDLAILRSLGADSGQLRAVVHWQASLVAAMVLIVAVPLGIIVARTVVALLTDALGITPGADVPALVVAAVIGTALIVANVLALLPARRAARARIVQLSLDR
ncbi:MAG: ABC transporter permease [Ilumatobacteraceae bacterium]